LFASNLNGSVIIIEINDFKIENEIVYNNKIDNRNLHQLINNNFNDFNCIGSQQKQIETVQNGKRKIKPVM